MASTEPLHRLTFRPSHGTSFPFFQLPREVRDHILSYLVVYHGRRIPILDAKTILRDQKKRAIVQRNRERLNVKRAQVGRRPVAPRETVLEPIIQSNVMQASRMLHYEATDCFYRHHHFAFTIDSLPSFTIQTPFKWDYSRIKRMQLELQLKDAQRMNSYIDWTPFFAMFPSLIYLRIIPSFHPRYYEWAQPELAEWSIAHYNYRAFFRELLASVPEHLVLKLGQSANSQDDMHLEGKAAVSKRVLRDMCADVGTKRYIGFDMLSKMIDGDETM